MAGGDSTRDRMAKLLDEYPFDAIDFDVLSPEEFDALGALTEQRAASSAEHAEAAAETWINLATRRAERAGSSPRRARAIAEEAAAMALREADAEESDGGDA